MKNYLLLLVAIIVFAMASHLAVAQAPVEKPVRVLIVTGVDYPGHPWRTQAMLLRQELGASKSLDVRLIENIEVLGTDLIFDYDVLMLNFKNYDPLKREELARKNLVNFMTEGGGLMYFHFTGGAFEDWQAFEQIVGRVWNPQLRGHDPYQQFTVDILKKDHPIMQGITAFPITDELYTCLVGKRDIEILATAKSSVDGKDYPMAFTLTEGKGRGFYTPLGHDARAFESPQLGQMLRNAALWCAKRENLLQPAPANTDSADVRLREIAGSLPDGAKLLAYLDCGGPGRFEQGLNIVVSEGAKPYRWQSGSAIEGVPPQQMSVLFHPQQVSFMLEGLDRSKRYQMNIVWWDFDAGGRAQSLTVQSPDRSMIRILRPGISLPDFKESHLPPRTMTMPLPMAFVRDGKLLVNVRSESGPNAVVSEIWISELP